jgi:4-alpha-glucanotransferase
MLAQILPRSSGVLLHPTSLPGPFGIGDLGPEAFSWLAALSRMGQSSWQMLPVGPTGYGDSPYQLLSTFAGNINLISPARLVEEGLATLGDEDGCFLAATEAVRYADVIPRKRRLVQQAWARFAAGNGPSNLHEGFTRFREHEAAWLEDFALFMAIKDEHGGKPWWEWPPRLAFRDDSALRAANQELAGEIDVHRFGQFLFFHQWNELRNFSQGNGVRIIGDLPIYVAEDSADVWANPGLFLQGPDHRPRFAAGVPPDYFSATGQLWGNPIYDWDSHCKTGYRWWIDRIRAALRLFDVIRFDHFRGIESFWAVPFGAATAEGGQWLPGPGASLLDALQNAIGELPIIAEDLGVITPQVDALRERFGLPGMRILQFAFGGAIESRFLPHRYSPNIAVYTGTHDNDTTAGWLDKLGEPERQQFARYAPASAEGPVRTLVRLAWASVADLAIAPLQDLLGLGSSARLNTPGTSSGNWEWRAPSGLFQHAEWMDWLSEITAVYERRLTDRPHSLDRGTA